MIPIRQTAKLAGGREVTLEAWAITPSVSLTGLSVSEAREVLTKAWEQAGAFWHRAILPKHFQFSAYAEYGYQKRNVRYEIRKAKRYGHRRPLVFSGNLERAARRIRDVRANAKGARVVIHGPKYLYAYRKDFKQPDKARELQAVSERDARALAEVLDRSLERSLGRARGARGYGAGHRTAEV